MQQKKIFDTYFWFLFFLSLVLLFPSLGKAPLWIYDEVRNAECAREMWERKDWIVPTFNGGLRTLKPPLHYYFMFGGFELFGITEWGARFFSAVFGVLTILITYFFVQRYSTKLHAFISGCVLLASTHFLFQFRMSVPDPYLIFFNTLSLFTVYAYLKERKFSWIFIAAVSFGLGTLAKGPVAIALPALSILCWLVWEKKFKQLFHWHIIVAIIVALAVALPWYILVDRATNGEWTQGFFFKHNIGRFSEPMEGHGGFFIIVPLFVLAGLLPASVFIGESLKGFRKHFQNPFLKLAFCITIAFVAFYSVSGTKLPNYPMPCYPFIAIILAYFIQQGLTGNTETRFYPFVILLVINIALPIGLYLGIRNEVELKGEESNAFLLLLLTIGSIISIIIFKRKGFKYSVTSLMIVYTLFNLIFLNYLYPQVYKNNPMSKTIDKVKRYENVVAYKTFHPSYTYYLPERVRVFDRPDSLQQYLQNNKAIIITRQASLPELSILQLDTVAIHHDLFESSTTSLLTNKKN
ncbi:MAG: glycosyltransferase family 39 protein [Bacteroidota bacterium]|nr:glycosyltransferase family 39 protein [Bacteroidota bacterium]